MARRTTPTTYAAIAWPYKLQCWEIEITGHPDWGDAIAFRIRDIDRKAREHIAEHTGQPADRINVEVQVRVARRPRR